MLATKWRLTGIKIFYQKNNNSVLISENRLSISADEPGIKLKDFLNDKNGSIKNFMTKFGLNYEHNYLIMESHLWKNNSNDVFHHVSHLAFNYIQYKYNNKLLRKDTKEKKYKIMKGKK